MTYAHSASPGAVEEGKRDRILHAMIEVVGERGFAGASVGLVIARAKVASRTFYELFDDLEHCFVAVLDMGLAHTGALITQAFEREHGWRDGVRAALASLLMFFDSEPLLARVWLVEAVAAGAWALERRENNVAMLRSLIVSWWGVVDSKEPAPLAAEGAMASVLGVVQAHVVSVESGPLIELLGPLMGLITLPYLDRAAVEEEITQGERLAREILAGHSPLPTPLPLVPASTPDRRIPDALRLPGARRARRCVLYIAAHPQASNREIAAGIGVAHQGQISTLLARLTRLGLLAKCPGAPGHPNAWSLTSEGEMVAQTLGDRRWATAFSERSHGSHS